AEGLPPLPSALTQAAKTPAAPEVVRLSVTVPKVLAPKDLWESFKDQPGAQLKSWCERVCPAALRQSFSWRETTLSQKGRSVVVLQGLAVVDKTKAEGLLDCSGQGGVFFCTDKASVQKKVQVKWMQSTEAETMPAYLKRVQDEARKSGLSIAWRVGDPVQLGLRCKPGTGSATPGVTAAWRVRKVPASWTEEDLLEALASAGWHELSVTSVPSFPKRPWFIRARAPHDAPCDLLGIEIGKDATLLLDRSVNPKASGQQSAGAATNSAATGQAASPDAGAQVTKRPRPVGTCDSDMPVDAEEGDKPKDPSADSKTCEPTQIDVGEGLSQPPPGADARVRHRTRSPVDVSWREIDAGGAGACGFNSVAVAYGLRQGEEEALLLTKAAARGKTLRQQVHQWIAEHKQEASDGWILDPRATETTEGGSLPTDFDTWHDNILRPNRWICQFTLRAAARRLGVRIVVVRHNGTSWEEPLAVGKAGRATQPLVLALRDDHYTVLVEQPLAVAFSKELPDDQTGFQCPFKKCRMRLPHLPSQARKRAKREHLRLVHPRYKGTLFQYSSLALKGAPKLTPGVSRTQRAKHAQERAKKQGSHDLVVYRPAAWPKDKRGSFVVCRRCLSVTQHEAPSIRHLPCEERLRRLREKPLVRMRKRQWWLRLKNTDVLEGQEFLRHTGLTTAQVDELVGCNDPPTARQQAWAAMSAKAKAKANKRKPRTTQGGGPRKRPASRLSSAQSAKHRLGGHRAERVGEAKHPGPGAGLLSGSASALSFLCLNTGGAVAAWTYVREHLAHDRPSWGGNMSDAEVLGVWVGGWMVVNMYAHPHEHGPSQAGTLLLDLFIADKIPPQQPWVLMGHHNELPSDPSVMGVARALGREYHGTGQPTRWEGRREIDWIACNRPDAVSSVSFGSDRISDHKDLRFQLAAAYTPVRVGVLPRTGRPPEVTTDQWRAALASAWAASPQVGALHSSLRRGCTDVQKLWDEFQRALRQTFVLAFQSVQVQPPPAAKLQAKGGRATVSWENQACNGPRLNPGLLKLNLMLMRPELRLCLLRCPPLKLRLFSLFRELMLCRDVLVGVLALARLMGGSIAAINGEDLYVTLLRVFEQLAEQGMVLALDFTKAFDALDARVTIEMLRKLKWPPDLLRVFSSVWMQLARYIQFQHHCHPEPLVAGVQPQGDPLGPLIMALWAQAGLLSVRGLTQAQSAQTTVYVDDRTIVAREARVLSLQEQSWAQWSASVGLLEHPAKTEATAITAALTRSLAETFRP
ncbi:unnamed protein product, partial [Symbiodinium microadriaticum]